MPTNNQQFEVRDMRKKEKFFIDDEFLNRYAKLCKIYATGVYVSLCRHANKEQICWPSHQKIADELAVSIRQVRYSLKILEKYHIIKVERMGKKMNNRYLLLDQNEWSDRHNMPISDRHNMPITPAPPAYHPLHHLPIHSKDTHSKDTHVRRNFFKKKIKNNPNTDTDTIQNAIESTRHELQQKGILKS